MTLATRMASTGWASVEAWFEVWGTPFWVALILVASVLTYLIVKTVIAHVVRQVVSGVKRRVDAADTEALQHSPLAQVRIVQRTRAIGTVLNTLLAWVVAAVAIILVLGVLGVNPGSLVAVAGFFGAAAGIGAQGVIKDFLNGLFIVFEDQLGIGDLVDLGPASGVVESVGIRVTQVRDVSGTLWYVRNGEITRVGNRSQGWARVLLDLAVPYDADVDRVQQRLLEVATELSEDDAWLSRIIDRPELWGIESLSPEAVVVRLVVKTRASAKDDVARELRARIRKALTELGVDLPPLGEVVANELEGGGQ